MNPTDAAKSGRGGRPRLLGDNTYDVDAAKHFLADHAGDVIVAFDHDARNPEVVIYTNTPDGALSGGDYYLWPLLHQTAQRVEREIREQDASDDRYNWRYPDRRRIAKWSRRLPLLTTLIRIRKATVQALCDWDLTNSRPAALRVMSTGRNLTGLTAEQAAEMLAGNGEGWQ